MTFVEAIQAVVRKYADFEGVAKRPEFWWWTLFAVLVSAALSVFNAVPIGGLIVLAIYLSKPSSSPILPEPPVVE